MVKIVMDARISKIIELIDEVVKLLNGLINYMQKADLK
jgi:hypothetical protein